MVGNFLTLAQADVSFLVRVLQQLLLAIGLALAFANALALARSRWNRRRHEMQPDDASRCGPPRRQPIESAHVRVGPALANIAIGIGVALLATASLTIG